MDFLFRLVRLLMIPISLLAFLKSGVIEGRETGKIPPIFHWIHLGESPLAKEEKDAIRSWQKIHPSSSFKLWSHASCSLKNVQICTPPSFCHDVESLRELILRQEGGVYVDFQLIGCKSIEKMLNEGAGFQSRDGYSFIGTEPNQDSSCRTILPDSFILPDQIFTTRISSAPLSGVCFRRFTTFPGLNESHLRIHQAKEEVNHQIRSITKKLSKTKILIPAILVLSLLNLYVFARWISLFRPSFAKRRVQIVLILFVAILPIFLFVKPLPTPSAPSIWNFNSLTNVSSYSRKLSSIDLKCLSLYNQLFSSYLSSGESNEKGAIPRTIHFIWGGPSFPNRSIPNIQSWMKLHPGWRFNFWTDDPSRPIPVEGMERRLFSELLSTSPIAPYFLESQNWGEKSDLLRYEILRLEGGLYVDHDIECLRTFAPFHSILHFYSSIEPLHQSPLYESHLTVTNCLIGAKPNHPIISEALELSLERWKKGGQIFPCKDQFSALLRTIYRTFSPFNEAVRSQIEDSARSLILPPSFLFPSHYPDSFSQALENSNYPLAIHKWDNTWFRDIDEVQIPNIPDELIQKISAFYRGISRIFSFSISLFLFLTITLFLKLKLDPLCGKKSYFLFFS